MIIRMENAEGLSLPQMEALLETSQEVRFAAKGRKEIYEWVERVLVRQEYAMQGKRTRGVVRAYLAKMTGKSLPQITRLVRQYRETGQGRARVYRRRKFVLVYTGAGVYLPKVQICPGVYGGGRGLAGEGESGARAAERAGHVADPGTVGRGVR